MLAPGSKGWISKYFDLVDRGEIVLSYKLPPGVSAEDFMRLNFTGSGLVFGYSLNLIFAKNLESTKWTQEEQLKLLLFEAHLLTYLLSNEQQEFKKEKFLASLYDFYRFHNVRSLIDVFRLFKKDSAVDVVEGILAKRVDIKLNIVDNKWWVNSLSNAFCYLDVILFNDYLQKRDDDSIINYNGYAQNALTGIVLSAYADGEIQEKEKVLFNVFLASSGLEDERRDKAKEQFRTGATFADFSEDIKEHWLLKHFILDIAALTIFSGSEMLNEEVEFLGRLSEYLDCDDLAAQESLVLVENFVLKARDKAIFLQDSGAYDKVYRSFTSRWSKVLLRNKDKIATELKESKQLINLIRKSAKEELSQDEKKEVRDQLKDLAKAVPALTLFMLPGGSILMPLLLKALPDLVPSAFRENQIDTDSASSEPETTDQ